MRVFTIKGISPGTDTLMEVEIVADTVTEARDRAETAGLRFVSVIGCEELDDDAGTTTSPAPSRSA